MRARFGRINLNSKIQIKHKNRILGLQTLHKLHRLQRLSQLRGLYTLSKFRPLVGTLHEKESNQKLEGKYLNLVRKMGNAIIYLFGNLKRSSLWTYVRTVAKHGKILKKRKITAYDYKGYAGYKIKLKYV